MKEKLLTVALPILLISVGTFAIYLWSGKTDSYRERLAEAVRQSDQVFREYLNAD